jgi:uncharacterized protein (UPF0332 family)
MNTEALDLWGRAKKALSAADILVHEDSDSSASRAYYAAFHAVSAYFILDDKTFSKHSALESAIHKDLVKPGLWPMDMGTNYSWLAAVRSTGDYGGGIHVSEHDAAMAVVKARQILEFVSSRHPDLFVLL